MKDLFNPISMALLLLAAAFALIIIAINLAFYEKDYGAAIIVGLVVVVLLIGVLIFILPLF